MSPPSTRTMVHEAGPGSRLDTYFYLPLDYTFRTQGRRLPRGLALAASAERVVSEGRSPAQTFRTRFVVRPPHGLWGRRRRLPE